MDRKIKLILMVVVILGLLFWQQMMGVGVSYAEDSAGKEVENEAVKGEEDKEVDNENNGEDTGEKEEEEEKEEADPVQQYQVSVSEPDGTNGYYVSSPKVAISHVSTVGVTCYQMCLGNRLLIEGRIEEQGKTINIPIESYQEGKNVLQIWMEDADGNRLEEYDKELVFFLDTLPPILTVSVPNGFETWYQDSVPVSAYAEDSNSQVQSIQCVAGGQMIGISDNDEGEFVVSQESVGGAGVPVLICAIDRAGNCAKEYSMLYIDRKDPQLSITGIDNYMITSRPVEVSCVIEEENELLIKEISLQIEYPDGREEKVTVDTWKESDTRNEIKQTLERDGIYQISLSATDLSGRHTELERRVIIDQENPIIQAIDEIDGQYYQMFRWEQPVENWIHDFTSYTYSIYLDGKLYPIGTDVWEEGWHILEVEATDAAKNRGTVKACFRVDHTAPEVVFHGLEEDGCYEEKVEFQVSLKDSEDIMNTISINGEKKELNSSENEYKYQILEPGNYEVAVEASDRAGNKTISRRLFQVTKKESVAEKMFGQVKKGLGLEKETIEEGNESVAGTKKREYLYIGMVAVSLLGIVIVGLYLYKNKRRENK